MERESPHHVSTVAAEPQLPGPGLRNPVPKNVATIHAHACLRMRRDELSGAGVGVVVVTVVRRLVHLSRVKARVFGIGDGSGDYVSTARPFAQVNQSAPLATEREVRIGAHHDLSAGGTTQAAKFLARHGELINYKIRATRS